jgi:predicted aldo/keto reductase-like oxidoreductase
MLEARQQGKILHIGITNHRLAVAQQAIDSGLYETLQFPFSYLASDKELSLVRQCAEHNIGFIAMKALSGGLITNAAAAYAFLAQFPHVVPIWGIQRLSELDEFISFQDCPPSLSPELQAIIDRDRVQLSGDFCRGCGYCLPCSVGIEINDCNRMSLFLQRAPYSVYLTEDFRQKMDLIDKCIDCGICKSRCPYNLDIPTLLKRNLADFREAWQHKSSLNPEG